MLSRFIVIGGLAVSLTTSPTFGAQVSLRFLSGYIGANGGGEFNATTSPGKPFDPYYVPGVTLITSGGITGFETFCMEYQEHLSSSTYSYAVNDYANLGGNTLAQRGGNPDHDPVSLGSAWLYGQFAAGTLPNYSYSTAGNARAASATELQKALWALEDETNASNVPWDTLATPGNNTFLNAVQTKFGSLAAAKADNNGLFAVQVLNVMTPVTSGPGQSVFARNQDVIVRTPDSSTPLGLLGLGLAALTLVRRRGLV